MSYILDALQRADAERARGGVPGLHARQVAATAQPPSGAARLGRWWPLAAVVVLAAAGIGFWLSRAPVVAAPPAVADTLSPREVVVAAQVAHPTPAPVYVVAPVPAPTLATAPSPVVVAPATLATSRAPDAQANRPLAVQPAPPTQPATPPTQPAAAAVKPATTAVAAASHASAATAAPATAIPWLADLPQDLRQSIPKLTITGTVYSENPSQRILVVNGQVLMQGSEVAPELTLAEIHPTHSDFIFRGTRFRVQH